MIPGSLALPIPVDGDIPPIVGVLFAIVAAGGFVVLVWQAVRYFRGGGSGGGDRSGDDRPGGDDRSDD